MQVYDTHDDDDADYNNPPWLTIAVAAFAALSFATIAAWAFTEAIKWLVN